VGSLVRAYLWIDGQSLQRFRVEVMSTGFLVADEQIDLIVRVLRHRFVSVPFSRTLRLVSLHRNRR
jgi:hypothetical protein